MGRYQAFGRIRSWSSARFSSLRTADQPSSRYTQARRDQRRAGGHERGDREAGQQLHRMHRAEVQNGAETRSSRP